MRRWMVAAVAAMAALTALAPATMAQTNLIPGGLTAVPPTALSPNLAQNPGFEANSGGVPTGWTGGGGWALDQQTTHSGSFSYRWSNGPSSDQPIFLKAGIYNFSAWIKTQGVGSGNAGLRLQVDFRPGGVGQWFTTDPIQGTADWTLYQIRSIVVPQDLQAALRLENFGGATGTAWFDDVVMVQQLPQPVDVFSSCRCGSRMRVGNVRVTPDLALRPGAVRWGIQTCSNAGYGPWSSPLDFTED